MVDVSTHLNLWIYPVINCAKKNYVWLLFVLIIWDASIYLGQKVICFLLARAVCAVCAGKKKPLALFPFNEILFFNTHGGQLFHLNILQGNYHRTIQVDSNQVELGLSLDVLPFEGQSGLLRLLLIISLKQFETYCWASL